MLKTINGFSFVALLESGVKNLIRHKQRLNDLNVFPVPDGDTGTNMVMTLQHAYDAITEKSNSIDEVSKKFATAAVFGARGNSGVIVSQFFKGISVALQGHEQADCALLAKALQSGNKYARKAVLKPVEGTMLTVVKDAANAVEASENFEDIESLIACYLEEAKASLQRTPDLLPVLKKAGVVDSGGSGIVCFFEGVQKYLKGEPIEIDEEWDAQKGIDFSLFNKDTQFVYGYCMEGVLQLKMDTSDFDQDALQNSLMRLGDSIVITVEGDKIKLHVHSKKPGDILNCCQAYGEFLTLKVENMTVQNVNKVSVKSQEEKILYRDEDSDAAFAVVAVAPNSYLQKKFFAMGADVVILSEIAPSAQEFIEAFGKTKAKEILVFPNSSNSILTSVQASSYHKKAKITVLNSRSATECHAALGVLDFDDTIDSAICSANAVLSNIQQVFVYHATRDVHYENVHVAKNEFFSMFNKKIVTSAKTLENVVLDTVQKVQQTKKYDLLTLFYGAGIAEQFAQGLAEKIMQTDDAPEVVTTTTEESLYSIALAFEG